MKIGIDSRFHLTYCTNIHPGESWDEVFTNLQQYLPVLKAKLSPEQPFGVGLRLADVAARKLLREDTLAQFQEWLNQQDLYVFTLNGFPYGGFHRQVVKDQVYAPDWSKPERVEYTLRLVRILAALLPAGVEGGISTVPLSYKPWWTTDTARESVMRKCSLNLAAVAVEMARIREETGKLLHVDLEPEPDGLMENAAEVIDFFKEWLLLKGGACLAKRLGISPKSAESLLRQHVRVCYDTCHFAVEYEDPVSVFPQLQAAGIGIGKIQLSAALQVKLPNDNTQGRRMLMERLRPFAESTYLHQVIERHADGTLHHYPDLVSALPYLEKTQATEWRTHFHVPIFIRDYQILQSTQADIVTVLELLQENHVCQHLEIETYAWDVLPPQMKMDLLASIQREYEWIVSNLKPSI